MADAVIWRPQMEVGYPPLDEEHKCFLNVINKAQFFAHEGDLARMDSVFESCYDYARNHFPHEEEVMERIQFPDLESHAAAHQKFIDNICELRQNFISSKDEKEREKAAILTADFLNVWFLGHTLSRDKIYKPYLVRLRHLPPRMNYYN